MNCKNPHARFASLSSISLGDTHPLLIKPTRNNINASYQVNSRVKGHEAPRHRLHQPAGNPGINQPTHHLNNMSNTYNGKCFCGAVEIEVSGAPNVQGYCHCRSCRSWSGGPVNGFSLWPAENFKVLKGEENIATYSGSEFSHRKWCKACGGHLINSHPGMNLVDVFSATIPTFEFKPTLHVHYGETVLPMKGDGLPKFKDLPADFGGSGETVDE